MMKYLAKHLYCLSLGFDQSEGLTAYEKERDRLRLLRRRLGDSSFDWRNSTIWPYFAVQAGVIVLVMALPVILVLWR